jgi:hypothetical protein
MGETRWSAEAADQPEGGLGAGGGRDDGELGLPQAADGVRGATGLAKEETDLIGHPLLLLVLRLGPGGGLGLRGKDHAGERVPAAEGLGADLFRPTREAPHVVEPSAGVEQAFLPQAVHLLLRLEEGRQLEQQRLAVQRLAEKLPGARLVRLEPLGASEGPEVVITMGSSR